jgi:hypothetical protein
MADSTCSNDTLPAAERPDATLDCVPDAPRGRHPKTPQSRHEDGCSKPQRVRVASIVQSLRLENVTVCPAWEWADMGYAGSRPYSWLMSIENRFGTRVHS